MNTVLQGDMIAKMLLPYSGVALLAAKDKQPAKVGVHKAKGTDIPHAPILRGRVTNGANNGRRIRIAKIPVLKKFVKSLDRLGRFSDSRLAAKYRPGQRLNLPPDIQGNLHGHGAALIIAYITETLSCFHQNFLYGLKPLKEWIENLPAYTPSYNFTIKSSRPAKCRLKAGQMGDFQSGTWR
jgi:hypothetical protein